ncbi:MAG: hypothetical protein C4527_15680 [Candidatus Omnitrophota bacterium]|jgi:hypothetical protein|nr:MAG: hypothetical protein C4527_15680 [Candidatus Omnitrophota bacterium]
MVAEKSSFRWRIRMPLFQPTGQPTAGRRFVFILKHRNNSRISFRIRLFFSSVPILFPRLLSGIMKSDLKKFGDFKRKGIL